MAENQDQGVAFNLEKIYVKDISYESPNSPQVFLEKAAPDVNVQLGIEHTPLNQDEGLYDVVLTVTVTAKNSERAVFLAEAKQGGIFRITGIPDSEMSKVLEISCPNILLPFVREVINDLVVKGGFPQLLLSPINFEALYLQKQSAGADQQIAH